MTKAYLLGKAIHIIYAPKGRIHTERVVLSLDDFIAKAKLPSRSPQQRQRLIDALTGAMTKPITLTLPSGTYTFGVIP